MYDKYKVDMKTCCRGLLTFQILLGCMKYAGIQHESNIIDIQNTVRPGVSHDSAIPLKSQAIAVVL